MNFTIINPDNNFTIHSINKNIYESINRIKIDHGIIYGNFGIEENNYKEYHKLIDKMSEIGGIDIYRKLYSDYKKYPGYTVDKFNKQSRQHYIFGINLSPKTKFKKVNGRIVIELDPEPKRESWIMKWIMKKINWVLKKMYNLFMKIEF